MKFQTKEKNLEKDKFRIAKINRQNVSRELFSSSTPKPVENASFYTPNSQPKVNQDLPSSSNQPPRQEASSGWRRKRGTRGNSQKRKKWIMGQQQQKQKEYRQKLYGGMLDFIETVLNREEDSQNSQGRPPKQANFKMQGKK